MKKLYTIIQMVKKGVSKLMVRLVF